MKDLTADVTHLVVGDYETAKYRHVAKAQPHTRAMDAGWIEALTDLWRGDSAIDFEALEKEWQLLPLEVSGVPAPTPENPEPTRGRLKVCLTGFPDRESPPVPWILRGPLYGGPLLTDTPQPRSGRTSRNGSRRAAASTRASSPGTAPRT